MTLANFRSTTNAIRDRCRAPGYDAVVVGAGPNGLAAAITLAEHGRAVLLLEGSSTIGGGCRSASLTLPGFVHDVCSAVHPLGLASPFFRGQDLSPYGLEWIQPQIPFAQPLDGEPAVLAHRSLGQTAGGLDGDAGSYLRTVAPLVAEWPAIVDLVLGPLRLPRHPVIAARFAPLALQSAHRLAHSVFQGERARALFAGAAGHSQMPFRYPATAGAALLLFLLAPAVGWPLARGGSQAIAAALANRLRDLGGEIITDAPVTALDDLPPARHTLLDLAPNQMLSLAGDRLPPLYRRQLRAYRYGPGAFKVDYALAGPIPWRDPALLGAGTVHLGGTFEEVARSEAQVAAGVPPERPYVLLVQPSLFDSTRAPAGKHVAWAYCHVPNGCTLDMTARLEAQIERFAPGFRDVVLARHVTTPADFQAYNPNYMGGDINAGAMLLQQIYTRPVLRRDPYATPVPGLFVCSASTPPAGGVHGMCGYWAARSALGSLPLVG